LFVRHARNLEFRHIEITSMQSDARAFVWLGDVDGADFSALRLSPRGGVPALRLHESRNVRIADSRGLPDRSLDQVEDGAFP
jgi:glutaredoxin-related protein